MLKGLEKPGEQHGVGAQEIPPAIKDALARHVADLEPLKVGKRELIKQLSGSSLGLANASIDRPNPPISVESAALIPGKSKVLIGPNRAGKTTFFDAFVDRDQAYVGTKSGDGAWVVGKPVHKRDRLRVARLDQEEILRGINDFSAGEVLNKAAQYFKSQFPIDWDNPEALEENLANQEAHARIEALVSKIASLFGMNEFLETKVRGLSGGERTKLSLFSILLSEPDVLLLDEPTNHLDLKSIAKLMSLFNEYQKAGVTILSASHVDWFLREAGVDGVIEISVDQQSRKLTDSSSPYSKYAKDPNRWRAPIIEGDLEWLQKNYGYKVGETVVSSPPTFSIENSPLKNVSMPTIHGGDLVILGGDNGSGKTKLMEAIVKSRGD